MIEPMLSAQQPAGASEKPAPTWVAIGSAVAMLAPLPLAVSLLAVLLGRRGHALSSLAEVFREGGAFVWGVFLAALVATVASSVLSWVGAKRGTFPASASGLVWALVLLVSFLGVKSNLDAVMMAMASVSPADKATILAASISELLTLQLWSSSLCAVACVSVALGQGLSALGGPHRASGVLGALGFLALAVSMAGSLMSAIGLRQGFSSVAMVSPEDKAEVLFQLAVEVSRFDRLAALGTLAAIGIALVGGVVVARLERRAGILAAAAVLVTAVGFRGVLLLTERTLSGTDLGSAMDDPGAYLPLKGFASVEGVRPWPLSIAGHPCPEISRRVKQQFDLRPTKASDVVQGIALEPTLTRDELSCALSAAHELGGGSVLLVGSGLPREMPRDFPALLRPFFVLFSATYTFAPVKPLFADEPQPSDVATLTREGVELQRAGEPVKSATPPDTAVDLMLTHLEPARCEWKGDPVPLARGAAAAAAQGSLLTIVVPRGE